MLAGIQVPAAERGYFERCLDEFGYPYWDETGDPAYRLFLDGNAPAEAAPCG